MASRPPLKSAVVLFLFAVSFSSAARSKPAPATADLSVPMANPNIITAGTPATVTVTVRISAAPRRVWLERVSFPNAASGASIASLGGRDDVYSARVQFNEPSPGTIFLQVAAAFPMAATLERTNAQTLRSRVFTVRVLPGQPGGRSSGPSGGGISTGEAVGIGAAIAGAAIAADWWKHHHDHATNPQPGRNLQKNGL